MDAEIIAETEVLIIGAGAAGLSLGRELKRRGVEFLILERGEAAGESWRRMPTRLRLVSPWKANRLHGALRGRWRRHDSVSRDQFAAYLKDYAVEHALPLWTGVAVQSVRMLSDGGGFVVSTTTGEFRCRRLVSATGCFGNPHVPELPGMEATGVRWIHYAEYGEAENIVRMTGGSGGRVLVVGKRLSAGQVMVELWEAGVEVALSHRSPIRYSSGPLAWWFVYRTFPAVEWWLLKIPGQARRTLDVRMEGGEARRLIEEGAVRTFPQIKHFHGGEVEFVDGTTWEPDLVIFATGFRPGLGHLSELNLELDRETGQPALDDMGSAEVPGLYFIGLDNERNFQSRFLRGIREDAGYLADKLSGGT